MITDYDNREIIMITDYDNTEIITLRYCGALTSDDDRGSATDLTSVCTRRLHIWRQCQQSTCSFAPQRYRKEHR